MGTIQKYLFLLLAFIFIGCSSANNTTKSNEKQKALNIYLEMQKVIAATEKFYYKKTTLKDMVVIMIEELSSYYTTELSKTDKKLLQQMLTVSKSENENFRKKLYSYFLTTINVILKHKKHSKKEVVDIATNKLMKRLNLRFHKNVTYNPGSVGLVLHNSERGKEIVETIQGSPAYYSELKKGDIVYSINGQNIDDYSLVQMRDLLIGKVNTTVVITVIRGSDIIPIQLKRQKIYYDTLSDKLVDGILYIKISSFFQKNMVAKIKDKINKLRKKNIKGIILDLRNNAGGILQETINIVDLFVDKGMILEIKGNNDKSNRTYNATKNTTLDIDLPMVILVNKGTASGSEIVAGVLQYYKKATTIGEKTFGSGFSDLSINFNSEKKLIIPTGVMYLANGKTIDKNGVTPDIYIKENKTSDLILDRAIQILTK